MDELKVHELVKQIRSGNKSAFTELYQETREDIYRMVSFILPNPSAGPVNAENLPSEYQSEYRETVKQIRDFEVKIRGSK